MWATVHLFQLLLLCCCHHPGFRWHRGQNPLDWLLLLLLLLLLNATVVDTFVDSIGAIVVLELPLAVEHRGANEKPICRVVTRSEVLVGQLKLEKKINVYMFRREEECVTLSLSDTYFNAKEFKVQCTF